MRFANRTERAELGRQAPSPRAPAGRASGFTLVEVSIILTVLSVLSLILLPGMGSYLRDARLARARGDLRAISVSILRFLEDTGEGAFRCGPDVYRETTDGYSYDPKSPDPDWVVWMLVGDGDTPDGGSDIWEWRRAIDGHKIDTIANHLVQNTPGDRWSSRYRTLADLFTDVPAAHFAFASQMGGNARFAWRGPYLSAPVSTDPWGNRYAVNVQFLDPISDSSGEEFAENLYDVFVLSAGPDEEVDTIYQVDGVSPGDDDLIAVIAGGSR